jgi:hypothetical protein
LLRVIAGRNSANQIKRQPFDPLFSF